MEIILDPGHGGSRDRGKSTASGVRGPSGTLEKDVTLRLAQLVSQHLGRQVAMTRAGDDNPTLGARADLARHHNARVFLSLHTNSGAAQSRGTETWVHERGGAGSQSLATSVQRSLSRLGAPDRGIKRGQLAVLTPERLAQGTAACLVEVDFLSDSLAERRLGNPGALAEIARAIADGVQAHLRAPTNGESSLALVRAQDAPSPYDTNYFNDTADLDAYLRDAIAADTLVVSQQPDAINVVNAFSGRSGASPWTSLDRGQVASRLQDLVNNPRLLNQGKLNLCGPASFFVCWAKRDPVGFATWATTLFENGQANIGTTSIAPNSDLLTQNYAQMVPAMQNDITPQADWMVLGAMRNSTSRLFFQPEWRGDPNQVLAGLTQPGEVADWLRATGIYSSVDNQANWTAPAGIPHALGLNPGLGTDVIVMLNTNALINNNLERAPNRPPQGFRTTPDRTFLLNLFPNHYVVLLSSPIYEGPTGVDAPGQQWVNLSLWTWGVPDLYQFRVPRQDFVDNYYGAIIARLRQPQ